MTSGMDDTIGGGPVKVELTNPKLKQHLHEYGRRRRTDGPYVDNLEVDALVVGKSDCGLGSDPATSATVSHAHFRKL